MCGLYRPCEGTVTIEGIDISCKDSFWTRSLVGVVEQKAGLLSGTIASNIAYGKDNATMEDIIQSAKEASAHNFISSLPDGYETQIGENSMLLSGGQAARIAIARALVKNPTYLFFDEATSSLDQENEFEVINVLKKLAQTKTIIAFTHSENMMQSSDIIHVLNGIYIYLFI